MAVSQTVIVGIVTRRKILSYILDKKLRNADWVFETLYFFVALIYFLMALGVYCCHETFALVLQNIGGQS